MPDPVSKAEIEDVLSSIRRLVSDNAGAIRRDADAEAENAEKLVLTPAFRVDEEDAAREDAEVTPSQSSIPGTNEPEPEAVPSDPEPVSVVSTAPEAAPEAAPETVPTHRDGTGSVHDDAMKSREEARPLSPLEQRIAELEAVVSRSAAEFEPDGSEDDALPKTVLFHHRLAEKAGMTAETVAKAEPDVPEAGHTWAMPGEEITETPVADLHPAEPEARFEVAEAEVDAAQERGDDGVETINDDEDTPDWHQDEAEFETVAPEAVETSQDNDAWEDVDEGRDGAQDGEAVIDEDALREMVARMVREELQGSVGERITHNVRRMVRREIARALSLQDID